MNASQTPSLLSAQTVLIGGSGRYWQFTTTSKARGALDHEAVYVLEDDALGLEELLTDHCRWFIAHGVSRLSPIEANSAAEQLYRLARMPDETVRRGLWRELADWLKGQAQTEVFVRRQVFR